MQLSLVIIRGKAMEIKVQSRANRQRALILYALAAALAAFSLLLGQFSAHASSLAANDNYVTRGRLAQQVSNAAGFSEDPGPQIFQDVPPSNHYYAWVNRLANRGIMGGYACGLAIWEPCVAPKNMPYFRPDIEAYRGQIAKIVSNAAGFSNDPTGQTFEDVAPGTTFYVWVQRMAARGLMSGFACGNNQYEPCVPPDNRPYFRTYDHMTMQELVTVVTNTFHKPGTTMKP
jgi:hypothetical protein